MVDICIDCPGDLVWKVLTDLSAYGQWNPFVIRAKGRLEVGNRLQMVVKIPGGPLLPLYPIVESFETNRVIAWKGSLMLPGLFDGVHRLGIEPLDAVRTRFVQTENFSGALEPVLGDYISRKAEKGFTLMNEALKRRVEQWKNLPKSTMT